MSKERGLIFNGEMVRAILDGRKTQTRRVLTPRQLRMIEAAASAGECYPLNSGQRHENSQSYYREWCPFGKTGDRIWVRETFNVDPYGYSYRADGDWIGDMKRNGAFGCDEKWTPSIHMPRWASRILLEITDIRVERLNDISECDAKAEGAPTECCVIGDKHFLGFRSLWKTIYGEESWRANPWVWVIEFKRVQERAA